jgi:hypothetical protein
LETSTHSGGGDSPASAARPRFTPAPKPRVPAGSHDPYRRRGVLVEEFLQGVVGPCASAVLHHDHCARPVAQDGADTALQQRSGVVVDHDCANRAGHQWPQYSLVKRNLTSALSAPKPSRQVISFPSSCSRPA